MGELGEEKRDLPGTVSTKAGYCSLCSFRVRISG